MNERQSPRSRQPNVPERGVYMVARLPVSRPLPREIGRWKVRLVQMPLQSNSTRSLLACHRFYKSVDNLQMSFQHTMSWKTEGVQVAAPVQWLQLDGMVTVLWEAEIHAGASGCYLADDPRIMFFFNDVSSHVRTLK